MPPLEVAPPLVLRAGARVVSLSQGIVIIGRLNDCELTLPGAGVSRRHTRIVPTAGGPLLEDRSRFGTLVNGARVAGPVLLFPGDIITVGGHEVLVELAGETQPDPAPAWRRRFATWRRRYGIAELFGTAALIVAAVVAHRLTGSLLLAMLGASLAEAVWFYGVLLIRARREAALEARRGGFERRRLAELGHELLLEFGTAELLDVLLIRPLCLLAGWRLAGGWWGLLLGKLVADLLFYGPVLTIWHWRGRGPAPDTGKEKYTTGAPLIGD